MLVPKLRSTGAPPPLNAPTFHGKTGACALGSPEAGSMVTKSRPSREGSVMPLGEFSRTNSERTPRQAFLDAKARRKHGGAGDVGEHHPAISRGSGRFIYRYLG